MIIVDEQELRKAGANNKILKMIKAATEAAPVEPVPTKEIDQNAAATLKLAEAIKDLATRPGGEAPDLLPIIEAIHDIQDSQLNVLQVLEKKFEATGPKNFEFTVVRNAKGNIHKILAKETK